MSNTKMNNRQGRARQLADLIERPVKDYDPETDVVSADSDADSNDNSVDDAAGTEHYVPVSKSTLRRPEPLSLGPQYRGSRVSRETLEADSDDDEEEEEEDDDGEDEEHKEQHSSDSASSEYEDAREEFDDPDTADLEADKQGREDAEIDSDDAFDESDEEKFKDFVFRGSSQPTPKKGKHAKRPTAADFMVSEDEDEVDEGEQDEGEEDDALEFDGTEGSSDDEMLDDEGSSDGSEIDGFIDDEAEESDDGVLNSSDEGVESSDEGSDEEEQSTDGNKSKSLNETGVAASVKKLTIGERSIAESLSKMVDGDVQKGRVVQRQRKGFDALLNIRIRLQKSLVVINSFKFAEQTEDQPIEPYEAAERSALQLWNALDDFRSTIQKGKKRKHAETVDTSTTALWDRMKTHEQYQGARRKRVLKKWSRDAKKTSIMARSVHNFTSNAEKPITDVLDAEMDAPDKLIRRTRTPRSCAPYQAAQKINEDASIFDDADFYQLLLKELVDQRSSDNFGSGLQTATVRYSAVKEAKAKRHVDTKASKGRKMRFTPMPKLQNFMAPEDRRSWEQNAIDRFFGTLFGQKMALNEETSDEEMGGASVEGEGLRLFRN
ncbi:TRAUB-domain-containing protein [Xylariaceae sp. FL1651]|nr:TRAUB-domain-containing protein [Xylariaceae sp. FL1651]